MRPTKTLCKEHEHKKTWIIVATFPVFHKWPYIFVEKLLAKISLVTCGSGVLFKEPRSFCLSHHNIINNFYIKFPVPSYNFTLLLSLWHTWTICTLRFCFLWMLVNCNKMHLMLPQCSSSLNFSTSLLPSRSSWISFCFDRNLLASRNIKQLIAAF